MKKQHIVIALLLLAAGCKPHQGNKLEQNKAKLAELKKKDEEMRAEVARKKR